MSYSVAVVGATGNVGREMLEILAERAFPADEVVALASERSVGKEVSYGDTKTLKVVNLADFDFTGIDLVLSSAGASVSKVHAPRAAEAGAVVIDNTSFFRMDPDVPLVVPEVNAMTASKRPASPGRASRMSPCSTVSSRLRRSASARRCFPSPPWPRPSADDRSHVQARRRARCCTGTATAPPDCRRCPPR